MVVRYIVLEYIVQCTTYLYQVMIVLQGLVLVPGTLVQCTGCNLRHVLMPMCSIYHEILIFVVLTLTEINMLKTLRQ